MHWVFLLACPLSGAQQEVGEIDYLHTKGMQLAEKRCQNLKMGKVAWSPELVDSNHKMH